MKLVSKLAVVLLALLAISTMGQSCNPAPTTGSTGTVSTTSSVTPPPDADGDLVADWCDDCVDAANRSQADRNADDVGDACDCDFNRDGYCNSDDANVFLADYGTGLDLLGVGTDMNGDGIVDAADYALFEPGFTAGGTTKQTTIPALTTTTHADGSKTITSEGPVLTTKEEDKNGNAPGRQKPKLHTSIPIPEQADFCGDLSCNGSETCSSCSLDCGACCASNGTICLTNGACCSGRCDLTCKSKLNNGSSCNEDSDCKSGDCSAPNIFTAKTCR